MFGYVVYLLTKSGTSIRNYLTEAYNNACQKLKNSWSSWHLRIRNISERNRKKLRTIANILSIRLELIKKRKRLNRCKRLFKISRRNDVPVVSRKVFELGDQRMMKNTLHTCQNGPSSWQVSAECRYGSSRQSAGSCPRKATSSRPGRRPAGPPGCRCSRSTQSCSGWSRWAAELLPHLKEEVERGRKM